MRENEETGIKKGGRREMVRANIKEEREGKKIEDSNN